MDHEGIAGGLFFVVGTGRCGSTVLRDVLAAHPRIVIPPETQFFLGLDPARFDVEPIESDEAFDRYLEQCRATPYWSLIDVDESRLRRDVLAGAGTARAVFLAILAQWADRTGKPRVGEKSPEHMKVVPRLRTLFPAARFIHIYRDPRAVAASMMRERWTHDNLWRHAKHWRRTMALDARYARRFGASYATLRYEDFVREPERHARELCAFLGETYDPAMLNPPAGTAGPPNTDSLERWRERLTPRQAAMVERTTQPWLARLGYTRTTRTPPHWPVVDTLDHGRHWVEKQVRSVHRRVKRVDRN